MSSIAKNKAELIKIIQTTYQKLRPEFADLPKAAIRELSMEGQIKGTKMSIHNLLSYLVGWGNLMLKWNRIYTNENRIPDLPDTGYNMNDWGKLAQRFYQDYAAEDFEKLLKHYDQVVAKILTMLEKIDDQELYGVDWYVTKSSAKGYSFGRMIQLNTASPYKNAYSRIRKWKKAHSIGSELSKN